MKQILQLLITTVLLTLISCASPANTSLMDKGDRAMWQGRWSDAATSYKKATLQHPGDWQAQYHLGQCYLEMGDATSASQSLAVAESLRPGDSEIAATYAESLLLSNEQDKLYTFLLHRAQKQQTTTDWINFAEYTMDLDDPDSAHQHWERWLELVGDNPELIDDINRVTKHLKTNECSHSKLSFKDRTPVM